MPPYHFRKIFEEQNFKVLYLIIRTTLWVSVKRAGVSDRDHDALVIAEVLAVYDFSGSVRGRGAAAFHLVAQSARFGLVVSTTGRGAIVGGNARNGDDVLSANMYVKYN